MLGLGECVRIHFLLLLHLKALESFESQLEELLISPLQPKSKGLGDSQQNNAEDASQLSLLSSARTISHHSR